MSFTYEPLWKMLNDSNISKMQFAEMVGISNVTLAKLGKNESVTLTIIDKICERFDCNIENVVRHIPNSTFSQSPFPVERGTIVTTSDISSQMTVTTSTGKDMYVLNNCPFVVVDVIIPSDDFEPEVAKKLTEDKYYIITPLHLNSAPSDLNYEVPFSNVEINGKPLSGYFSPKEENHSLISSGVFSRCLGTMPEEYLDEYDEYFQNLYS